MDNTKVKGVGELNKEDRNCEIELRLLDVNLVYLKTKTKVFTKTPTYKYKLEQITNPPPPTYNYEYLDLFLFQDLNSKIQRFRTEHRERTGSLLSKKLSSIREYTILRGSPSDSLYCVYKRGLGYDGTFLSTLIFKDGVMKKDFQKQKRRSIMKEIDFYYATLDILTTLTAIVNNISILESTKEINEHYTDVERKFIGSIMADINKGLQTTYEEKILEHLLVSKSPLMRNTYRELTKGYNKMVGKVITVPNTIEGYNLTPYRRRITSETQLVGLYVLSILIPIFASTLYEFLPEKKQNMYDITGGVALRSIDNFRLIVEEVEGVEFNPIIVSSSLGVYETHTNIIAVPENLNGYNELR